MPKPQDISTPSPELNRNASGEGRERPIQRSAWIEWHQGPLGGWHPKAYAEQGASRDLYVPAERLEVMRTALTDLLNVADIEGWYARHSEEIDAARDALSKG